MIQCLALMQQMSLLLIKFYIQTTWHMGHEQNFWDRIQNTDDIPNLLDPIKVHAHGKWASEDWTRLCVDLATFIKDVVTTPPEQFDQDTAFDRLNEMMARWVNIKPEEAIGLAEAFIEAPGSSPEAASMLIWNFLFTLYKKFWYNFNSHKWNDDNDNDQDEEQASDE